MDTVLKKITEFVMKYRFPLLVLLIGLVLMLLPTGSGETETVVNEPVREETEDVSEELAAILAQIKGVGKVQVMLTVETGERTVYQTEGDNDTVIITDAERAQQGLVRESMGPTYRGAVVVCQGADSPAVRLSVTEAVCAVTGLPSDKVTVLKMK